MSLRWTCPLCDVRYLWFVKSCRPCGMKLVLAAMDRAMSSALKVFVGGEYAKPGALERGEGEAS